MIMAQDAIWMQENMDGYPAGLTTASRTTTTRSTAEDDA